MNRRLPILITLALVLLLLVLAGALVFAVNYYARQKERDLEQRLAAIASTMSNLFEERALARLAATYEDALAREEAAAGPLDVVPDFGATILATWPEAFLLEPAEAAEQSYALEFVLEDVQESQDLRSLSLLTESGITLASTDPENPPGLRFLLYEIDRAELEEAAATGEAAAKPLYPLDGELQKRIYYPFPRYEIEAGSEGAPLPGPRIFGRLEASATYLAELQRLRHLARLVILIALVVVVLLGVVFYFLLRRLQRTTEHLAQADRLRSLGKLAAGLAHELRNPLGILRFNVDEIAWQAREAQRPPAGETKAQLERLTRDMYDEIDRMNRLISNVLTFSQEAEIDARGNCRLEETLRSCAKWLEKSAPDHWQLLLPDFAEIFRDRTDLRAAMSGDALRQVVLNVLRNAVEALEGQRDPAPRIAMGVRFPEGGESERTSTRRCQVVIADNGHGISRKAARRIFEPFYTSKSQGTGLGLPLSYRLMQSVGGNLRYEPNQPRGAVFLLDIPLAE